MKIFQFCASIVSDQGITLREIRDESNGFAAIAVSAGIGRKEIREADYSRAGAVGDATGDNLTVALRPEESERCIGEERG